MASAGSVVPDGPMGDDAPVAEAGNRVFETKQRIMLSEVEASRV